MPHIEQFGISSPGSVRSELLSAGEFTPPRTIGTGFSLTLSTGVLTFTSFVSLRTEAINTVTVYTGTTAAGGAVTLVRYGIFSVASNGDLTLVASTANDTTLLASASTPYPKALQATFNKVAGTEYAVGVLAVSSNSLPTIVGGVSAAGTAALNTQALLPRTGGRVSGQTDLLSSYAVGSLSTQNGLYAFYLS